MLTTPSFDIPGGSPNTASRSVCGCKRGRHYSGRNGGSGFVRRFIWETCDDGTLFRHKPHCYESGVRAGGNGAGITVPADRSKQVRAARSGQSPGPGKRQASSTHSRVEKSEGRGQNGEALV